MKKLSIFIAILVVGVILPVLLFADLRSALLNDPIMSFLGMGKANAASGEVVFDTPPTRESLAASGWECTDILPGSYSDQKDMWKCSNKEGVVVSGGTSPDGEYYYDYYTYDEGYEGPRRSPKK